jgi:hypothetical protein
MDTPAEVVETVAKAIHDVPEAPPQPVHVMVDIETWGTGNDAIPVSLGACKFDGTEILDQFHVGIDPASAQAFGLSIDASTILWWFDPERDEARRQWLELQKVDLASALMGFAEWCGTGSPAVALWGNGSTFDNIILRSAYKAVGLAYPVPFWADQCYRTMKNRTPGIKLERIGTHHNALDDAISQAKHLQRIIAQVGGPLAHIEEMQDKVREYLDPQGNVAPGDFINQMIGRLDGPEQRERVTPAAGLVL